MSGGAAPAVGGSIAVHHLRRPMGFVQVPAVHRPQGLAQVPAAQGCALPVAVHAFSQRSVPISRQPGVRPQAQRESSSRACTRAGIDVVPTTVQAAFATLRAVLARMRCFRARVLLVLSLGLLTATSAPAWSEAPLSSSSLHTTPDMHLVARADRSSPQNAVGHDNVRAWHKAWGGRFDDLPMWTKMARERVVMHGLRPDEIFAGGAHAVECHAVWSNPLKYVYTMTYGTIPERTAYLDGIKAPTPPTAQGALAGTATDAPARASGKAAAGLEGSGVNNAEGQDKRAAVMREALQEARQQRREKAADTVESGALTGRLVAAGTAFAIVAMMRSPQVPSADSWQGTNFSSSSSPSPSSPEIARVAGLAGNMSVGLSEREMSAKGAANASAAASRPKWTSAPGGLVDTSVSSETVAALAAKAALYTPPVRWVTEREETGGEIEGGWGLGGARNE